MAAGALGRGEAPAGFIGAVAVWLWFTVLFANFAEALAEGRGKAQAEALRRTRQETQARKLRQPRHDSSFDLVPSTALRQGDHFLVQAGDIIPADGEVVEGIASVDESAVTGESAPVIRESGGDRSAVTGGTRVLSDWLVVRVTANPGEGFLDRMIALVEGARRQKTPNEIALNILLAAFTIIFLGVCVTLLPFSLYSVQSAGQGTADHGDGARGPAGVPDPDHDRRPAVGHRHRRHGPPDPAQRDRALGPGGGGGRRRGRAAAGQDRHHHPRQPAGGRVHPGGRLSPSASWPRRRSSPRWPTRRRRAAASWCWPRRSTACAAARWARGPTARAADPACPVRARRDALYPLHRPDAHERRGPGWAAHPQGGARCHRWR